MDQEFTALFRVANQLHAPFKQCEDCLGLGALVEKDLIFLQAHLRTGRDHLLPILLTEVGQQGHIGKYISVHGNSS
ncbi:MAG: hypothetical protein DRJ65_21375 [Acidobacteria bacterium]|nr:MAG: hypothetical protein DRJ65_21375 [Acidobacteriota bacterium]